MCHGDQGQGKPAMGAPKLVGTTKSVVDVLTKGGEAKAPHIKAMSTVTADQAAALAAYVKTLK
jgi:mono/diheme cytochrome c family protein